MTGPMSNLGLALLKEPELAGQIEEEVIAISGMFGLNEAAFANATRHPAKRVECVCGLGFSTLYTALA